MTASDPSVAINADWYLFAWVAQRKLVSVFASAVADIGAEAAQQADAPAAGGEFGEVAAVFRERRGGGVEGSAGVLDDQLGGRTGHGEGNGDFSAAAVAHGVADRFLGRHMQA